MTENHVLASDAKGRLFTWGTGSEGELGLDVNHTKIPQVVKKNKNLEVKEIAVAPRISMIKASTGHLYDLNKG